MNKYPTNADGSLSFSLKAAKEYAMSTGDSNLLMAVCNVEIKKAKSAVFKAKLVGAEDRIERLEARIAEEREIQEGGTAELSVLQADADIEAKAFQNYVAENHA